jgi:hypothetical protein
MAETTTLNVSLKASSIPYGFAAQAALANVEASFLDTAEHEISLRHNGKLVIDQTEIASKLAGLAASAGSNSKVLQFHYGFVLHLMHFQR